MLHTAQAARRATSARQARPAAALCLGALLLLAPGAGCSARAVNAGDYAVVVSQRTAEAPDWQLVVQALAAKHRATILTYRDDVTEVLPRLRACFPRYACFVARSTEATRAFVAEVHRLTRRLDDDPYTDCFWGILTGYDAANALRIAQQSAPLTVRRVAGGTELALDMVEEGVWYCELNKNKAVKKAPGKPAGEIRVPDDTTAALVAALNEYHADLFVTSGHATEHDWQIGFRYRNGVFQHANGRLYGLDTQGRKFPIDSPNPKLYLPVGNCLMGHIDRPDCMATAWMNSAGVCQMLGYTQPTWYGYMGWGVLDYFVEQPGRFTLTEAFFANQAALIHRLQSSGLSDADKQGLLYDRDAVAFYGDPAWEARMADRDKAWDQQLTERDGAYTFEIRPRRGAQSFAPVNTNGSQRGGRPIIAFLPHRLKNITLTAGQELQPVVTGKFVLVPNPGRCEPGRVYRITFHADCTGAGDSK